MALSNTAVPIYYGHFREMVKLGLIPVNNEISLEMNRIDALIADPNIYYDDQAIEGFIRYAEQECTLANGDKLDMLDSFKLWAEQLFGWYYFVKRPVYDPTVGHEVVKIIKKRLVKKQYLIVARGAAKSMYASLIQSYFLNIDVSTTHSYTVAPTMKQADEVMAPIRTAIQRSPGPLFKLLTAGSIHNTTGSRFLRQQLVPTKKGIENFFTGSTLEVRPMSVDKLQGLQPKCSTIDEWLSGDTREDVIAALEQGATKNDDWVIVAISSEGTVRNGVGDTIKMELAKILKGTDGYKAPHISIFHYKLDDIKEVAFPELWVKANPNLGKTVEYDAYHLDVERMEHASSQKNDILAKRFGLPMEGHSYFFSYPETIPHSPRKSFDNMACSLGVDLSQGDDFCAFTFMFPLRNGSFGVKTRSYITRLTLDKLPGAARQKYQEFIDEGTLVIMENCTVLDMNDVYDDLLKFIDLHKYDIRCMGYDTYNSKEFMARYVVDFGEWSNEKVIQGARTESVPLGELKTLSEQRLLIFDQLLMMYTMGNAITITDTNGNRKLSKMRNEEKVDNVAALMDAYVAYKAHKEMF